MEDIRASVRRWTVSRPVFHSVRIACAGALVLALSTSGRGVDGASDPVVPPETRAECAGCFVDSRDGNVYPVIEVAGRRWLASNLSFDARGSSCGDADSATCARAGRFYTWGSARTACPSGWHLASDSEWNALSSALGGDDSAGIGLKSRVGWSSGGNGTDRFGFGALPAGIRFGYGVQDGAGTRAFFWTSAEGGRGRAWYRSLDASYRDLNRSDMDTLNGLSVRCVDSIPVAAGRSRDSKSMTAAVVPSSDRIRALPARSAP